MTAELREELRKRRKDLESGLECLHLAQLKLHPGGTLFSVCKPRTSSEGKGG